MNNRLIIIIIFFIFLFLPFFIDIQPISNSGYNTDEKQIIDAIESISSSVVGISVINKNSNPKLSWEIKDGIFYPYTEKDSIIKSLGSGLIYSNNGYTIYEYEK